MSCSSAGIPTLDSVRAFWVRQYNGIDDIVTVENKLLTEHAYPTPNRLSDAQVLWTVHEPEHNSMEPFLLVDSPTSPQSPICRAILPSYHEVYDGRLPGRMIHYMRAVSLTGMNGPTTSALASRASEVIPVYRQTLRTLARGRLASDRRMEANTGVQRDHSRRRRASRSRNRQSSVPIPRIADRFMCLITDGIRGSTGRFTRCWRVLDRNATERTIPRLDLQVPWTELSTEETREAIKSFCDADEQRQTDLRNSFARGEDREHIEEDY